MNEVKRYAIISDDWDYVESPSGGFVDHDDYAALEAECERLRGEISDLHTTMMAAAVEIQEHWATHCDEDGYGPNNLMYRLENGIAAQYGYTAQTIVRLEAERDAMAAKLEGANDRARILLDAKNLWAERARKAEAELAAIKGQQPVAFYWQDLDCPEPHKHGPRKHGPYFGWPGVLALRNVDGRAIPVPLYTLPPASHDQEGA